MAADQPTTRSHRRLTPRAKSKSGKPGGSLRKGALQGILVPAFREASGLGVVARTAARAGCQLLLVCSGRITAREAVTSVRGFEPDVPVLAIDLPPHHQLPGFRVDLPQPTRWNWASRHDAHRKRNLGLLVARQLGWERALLLNDDICGFDEAQLAATVRPLLSDPVRACGWAFDDFPDNSVVCHANRLAGGEQSTSIGDGALALRLGSDTAFFPPVYNEDWLFLFDHVCREEVALAEAPAGNEVRQDRYDPFADPQRAAAEEFGDVLAEGLFALLHQCSTMENAIREARSVAFWKNQLRERQALLEAIDMRLAAGHLPAGIYGAGAEFRPVTPPPALVKRVRLRLQEARLQHTSEWPELLVKFVRAWRSAHGRWEELLDRTWAHGDVDLALDTVGLDPTSAVRAGDWTPRGPAFCEALERTPSSA